MSGAYLTHVERLALVADIERWCHRTRTGVGAFGSATVNDGNLVSRLRTARQRMRRDLGERLRAWMAEHPNGPPATPTLSAIEAERIAAMREAADAARAERAERARKLLASEAVQTALADTPSDAIRAVQRRWPELWERVVAASRDTDMTPGAMMMHAIERGLEAGQ